MRIWQRSGEKSCGDMNGGLRRGRERGGGEMRGGESGGRGERGGERCGSYREGEKRGAKARNPEEKKKFTQIQSVGNYFGSNGGNFQVPAEGSVWQPLGKSTVKKRILLLPQVAKGRKQLAGVSQPCPLPKL